MQEGHLRRMCPKLGKNNFVYNWREGGVYKSSDSESDEVIVPIHRLSLQQCTPILMLLNVHGLKLEMECDTGSAISCINYQLYKKHFSTLHIKPTNLVLRYYTGELVNPVGVIRPLVEYNKIQKILDLYVIDKGNTVLLGRQWMAELNITVSALQYNTVNNNENLDQSFNFAEFSSRYSEVFADGLGRFTGGRVSIHVREGARPVFMRARPLAYALREPVERALEQLVRDDILTPVSHSDWAAPIVPVVKKDGTIRICADFKLSLNKVLEVDRYPLPKVEDLLSRLHGGERFSKVDLSQAYAQFELDDTRKYAVINTHKGLYMYKRLVYGLSSSPGVFQRRLEQLFADIPRVGVFLDDIIITGKDTRQHLDNLHKVFERLKSSGLKVKKEKCSFFVESLEYLGYVISKEGVHTCKDKVEAIVKTPIPRNVSELRAFIGMVMYYGKFIKNVSSILTPLYNLLRAGVKYEWSDGCEEAFARVKRALSTSEVLVHYSLELPLVLTADASATGIGAVISHITPDGERPIAYASRTLNSAERSYAQIDREALAIIYGVRKFHQYLYGRKFTLRTDHKPLTYIFGNKVGIPVMAASRLQRWAIILSGYSYNIEYVASAKNCADALSRLPTPSSDKNKIGCEYTYLNFAESFLPVTNDDVRVATARDRVLSRVMVSVQSGWPSHCAEEVIKPYFNRRHELYVERGCIMWGYRVVIPPTLRNTILKELHVSHMGIVKTKSMARSFVWWPNIDTDIESTCRSCETCAMEATAPPQAAPRSWPYITQPWSRLHIDFLGPYRGKTFFVIIDSSTKWIEVFEMDKTNATAVVKVMRSLFARFGLPLEIVSDQGPPFTSAELGEFLRLNGIKQSFSPVYHPASNGAAENAVKLCKRTIKKAIRDSVDIDTALQTYLLAYRNSIQSTTGESPAMLLQRRPLRSRLDLLRADRARQERVDRVQRQQMLSSGAEPTQQYAAGETIWARNYGSSDKWMKGTLVNQQGSRRYVVKGDDGRLLTRHSDQIRLRTRRSSLVYPELISEERVGGGVVEQQQQQLSPRISNAKVGEGAGSGEAGSEDLVVSDVPEGTASKTSPGRDTPPLATDSNVASSVSRPTRVRRKPIRYGFEFD